MAHQYTNEEIIAYENAMPTKRTGVMTALLNPRGEVLTVKPTYKPGWNLVGGIIDAGESPLMAAVRETHEETNLQIEPGRFQLLGVHYLGARRTTDFLRVLFKVTLTGAEIAAITLQASEIEDSKFVAISDLAESPERSPMRAIYHILSGGSGSGYVENSNLKTS